MKADPHRYRPKAKRKAPPPSAPTRGQRALTSPEYKQWYRDGADLGPRDAFRDDSETIPDPDDWVGLE